MQRDSPRRAAGWPSKLLFCWQIPLIRLGNRKNLELNDLYRVLPEDSADHLGEELRKRWDAECLLYRSRSTSKSRSSPSLMRAMFRTFGFDFGIATFFLIFQQTVLKPAACVALGYLLRYFDGEYTDNIGWVIASILISLVGLSSLIRHPALFATAHVAQKMRLAVSNLLYRKALRLSHNSLSSSSVGHMINLMSNDVNRYDRHLINAPYLFICPILLIVTPCVLWNYIGPSSLVGVAILILIIPFQSYVGRQFGKMRTQIGRRTDERLGLVSQVLNGLVLIKMSAWESPFAELVLDARRAEMRLILKRSYLMAFNFSIFHISSKVILLATFIVYILTGNSLIAEKVFVTSSLYNTARLVVTQVFPLAIAGMAEIIASTSRIEEMLLLDERPESLLRSRGNTNEAFVDDNFIKQEPYVSVSELTACWPGKDKKLSLNCVSLSTSSGNLIGITGVSGSGKSAFLQALLKELPNESGKIAIEGQIAYAPQDPWLFPGSIRDNILMGRAFDENWYQTVTEVCALSRDFTVLPDGDRSPVGDNGVRLSGGQKARVNLARAVYANADIYLLDDPLSAVDARVGRHLIDKCICGILKSKVVVLVTHQVHHLRSAAEILTMANGTVIERGSFSSIANSNSIVEADEEIEESSDGSCDLPKVKPSQSLVPEPDDSESSGAQIVGPSLYLKYFRAGNSLFCVIALILLRLVTEFSSGGADFWLKLWTDNEETGSQMGQLHLSRNEYIYIFCGIVSATFLLSLAALLLLFSVLAASSIALHRSLFSAVIRAPMSFFATNSSGRVLNRFSNDMGNIDEGIPFLTYLVTNTMLQVVGEVVLIVLVSPFMIFPALVLFILASFLARFYLRFSISVKHLEASSRSNLYSKISTATQGLTTIRAFQAETIFVNQFMEALDNHSSAYYAYLASSRWFALSVEWLCNLFYAGIIIALILSAAGPAEAGLALSVGIMLGDMMGFTFAQFAELENEMVSVNRILKYSEIEPEGELEIPKTQPAESWPESGKIQMDSISLKYGDDKPVLQDISFHVASKEKVGIVGRTGSGKSTLIRALFRIVEPYSGSMNIDDVNIQQIGLHALRSKISIIPQNPVLFTGSIRFNLDPFLKYNDDKLWSALEQVQLKNRIMSASEAGLEAKVNTGGSNFSQGEIQLLCLARAILSSNRILVLDEATANIDSKTDAIIQRTIRECFAECTVLTVAHRLDTVMDSDRICVMDAGRIAEFDVPFNLLQNKNGVLHQLVQQTGSAQAEVLTDFAYQKINDSH